MWRAGARAKLRKHAEVTDCCIDKCRACPVLLEKGWLISGILERAVHIIADVVCDEQDEAWRDLPNAIRDRRPEAPYAVSPAPGEHILADAIDSSSRKPPIIVGGVARNKALEEEAAS